MTIPATATPTVEVTGGLIQGYSSSFDPTITIYKGVPYAAPPIGPNRFKPPQPVTPWTGVKNCDTNGPMCPQVAPNPNYKPTLDGVPQSEDCLYLNVFVPDEEKHDKPYPVLVWLHGGAFREGGSADPNFDGTGLAQKGVITVVPCFRLAIFGFFAHPDLTAESSTGSSGMMGMQDALQVLQWINANIAQFGGDPTRVTVAGQSAGSSMTNLLLLCPHSKGLMHRAIISSGPRTSWEPTITSAPPSYRPLKKAEQEGVDLVKELGYSSFAELREKATTEALVAPSARKDTTVWGPPPFWRVVLDGYIHQKPYHKTFADGVPNDIPVMVGSNQHETLFYNEPRFTVQDLEDSVQGRFNGGCGNGSPELIKRFYEQYPREDDAVGKGPLDAWNRAAADHARLQLSLWAQEYNQSAKSPVYGYYFTHHIQPWYDWAPDYSAPKTPGFTTGKGPLYGAYHSAEFAYTFNSLITNNLRPWTDEDRVIGEKLSTLWCNFAKYGNPNGRADGTDRVKGVAEWPSLQSNPNALLEWGGNFDLMTVAGPAETAFWKDFHSIQNPY